MRSQAFSKQKILDFKIVVETETRMGLRSEVRQWRAFKEMEEKRASIRVLEKAQSRLARVELERQLD